MSKRRILKLTIAFIVAIGALGFKFSHKIWSPKAPCKTMLYPVHSKKIEFMKERSPLETSIVRLNNRLYYILTYMTGPNSTYNSTPVFFFPLTEEGFVSSLPVSFGKSEHVRHLTKLSTPWGEGVLMADHGKDGDGFPGGNLLLIVYDEKDRKLIDKSSELKQKRNFAFNVSAVRRNHTHYDDILVTPYNGPKSRVVYLKATDKGYEDATNSLPDDWIKFKVCFMTSVPVDIDHDGKDEIALGGCDLNRNQKTIGRDQLLEWDNSQWRFSNEKMFPLRKRDSNWGTVYWWKDGQKLVALTHNKGFTEADIQTFAYDKNQQRFAESETILEVKKRSHLPHYFHKVQKFKDVLYGLIRYGSADFKRPNLLALSLDPKGRVQEVNVCLKTPPKEVVLGIDTFNNISGKTMLLVTYYSGRYDVFE